MKAPSANNKENKMTSGNEKNTASSINERIKDIIRFSYTKDELFQALLYSDLLEKVLSPIDVQALEDRFTQIKIADAYSDYRNGKTNIVDMNKDSALKLLDRFGDGMTGPDDEGLFLIDEEDGMFTAIDNTTGDCWTENFPSRALAVAYLSGFEFDLLDDYIKRHSVESAASQDAFKDDNRTAINLSQKTASSREASTRLSDEIGAKSCTRDEGTVGDS